MSLDAIIISNFGTASLSGSNPQRLSLNGRVADIQTILNYIQNDGKILNPIVGSDRENWTVAPTLNGLILTSFLNGKGTPLNSSMIFTVKKTSSSMQFTINQN